MKVYELLPDSLYQRGEFIKASLKEKRKFLEDTGIDVIVNVWTHEDKEIIPYLYEYIYYPMTDGNNFDPLELIDLAEYVAVLIEASHKVLIHCHAGRNRSSLVSALVIREVYDISGHYAMECVKKARPNSFGNKYHVDFLEGLGLPYDNKRARNLRLG